MKHLSGGDGLSNYVKAVTGDASNKMNEGKGFKQSVKADPKVVEKLLKQIKKQTAEILEKTQELYEMKTEKRIGDALIELETATNKIVNL
jgi:uncharacterized protein YdiU (UPF0061 family)